LLPETYYNLKQEVIYMVKLLMIFAAPLAKILGIFIDAWQTRQSKKLQEASDRLRNAELAQRRAAIDALDAAQRRDDAQEVLDRTAADDLKLAQQLADLAKRSAQ
jgi:hypothetical protein